MIINLNKAIAFVCPECITPVTNKLSLFDIPFKSNLEIACNSKKCNAAPIVISKRKNSYIIKLKCPICSDEHSFKFSLSKLIKSSAIPLKCPDTAEIIGALGDMEYIKDAAEDIADISLLYSGDNMEISNYDLLYHIVDRLSELNEQQMIRCKCGCSDIDLDINESQIVLSCIKCNKSMYIDIDGDKLYLLLNTVSLTIT